MTVVMKRTTDPREALEWIEGYLGGGTAVTVQQPGLGLPVEWTPQRWAEMIDDLHIPPFRTRDGQLLMCITTDGWGGSPEYVIVTTEEVVIYAR